MHLQILDEESKTRKLRQSSSSYSLRQMGAICKQITCSCQQCALLAGEAGGMQCHACDGEQRKKAPAAKGQESMRRRGGEALETESGGYDNVVGRVWHVAMRALSSPMAPLPNSADSASAMQLRAVRSARFVTACVLAISHQK